MALFGQLSKPSKELPLIDVSNPDIMMELLEELAITASTSDWINLHEPHHAEAEDIHAQAREVYEDFLGILQGKIKDKRINRHVTWAGDELREHLLRHEGEGEGDVIERAIKRFLEAFLNLARASHEGQAPISRLQYYAFMSGWAHYFAGLAPDETPPSHTESVSAKEEAENGQS